MSPAVTPTPRDQRVRILVSLTRPQLFDRALALGYAFATVDVAVVTNDELIGMILDGEQDRGMVAR